MSYSWFRLDADMVDHPKTWQLATILNEPLAGWYVIRLFSWLSRYAARGRLAPGLAPHLEQSCGWRGEPGKLTSALVESGWLDQLDDGTLEAHDWWEKQKALVEKAEKDSARKRDARAAARASQTDVTQTGARPSAGQSADKKAAGAGTRRDETRRDKEREEAEPPTHEISKLQELWNSKKAAAQPVWKETSRGRASHAKARLEERPLFDWVPIIERIAASDFCCGQNDRGWKADPDWLLKPDTAIRVMEGRYDNKTDLFGAQTPAKPSLEHRPSRLL